MIDPITVALVLIVILAIASVVSSFISTTLESLNSFWLIIVFTIIIFLLLGNNLPFFQKDDSVNTLREDYTELEEKYDFMLKEFDKLDGLLALRRYKEFSKDLDAIKEINNDLNKGKILNKEDKEFTEFQTKLDSFQVKYENFGFKEFVTQNNRISNLDNEFNKEINSLKELLNKKRIPRAEVDSTIITLTEIKDTLIKMR